MPESSFDPRCVLHEEVHYRLLSLLEERPDATQRELAKALNVSLGKTNYCVKALADRGWIKAKNFKNSHNKRAYVYLLTPRGIEAKARIMARFLKRRLAEYEVLKAEIAQLTTEVSRAAHAGEADNPCSVESPVLISSHRSEKKRTDKRG